MPPSAKRPQRVKRELPTDGGADVDTPNSSPSQPAKRRRTKANAPDPAPAANKPAKNQSELQMSDEELVTIVSQHLALPEHFVQVARDHDNDHHQRQSKDVAAYAKVTGRNWTFYVKRLRTNIGRPPEGYVPPTNDGTIDPLPSNEGLEFPGAETEPSRIHIDLGPNKLVSRLHAEIYFDSASSRWNIVVNGRNGVKVNDQHLRRGQKFKLSSGHVIEIGGVEMMFVLPGDDTKVQIHEKYLRRANLIQSEPWDDQPGDQGGRSQQNGGGSSSQNHAGGGPAGQLPIAPAPPDYKRPDTPIKNRKQSNFSGNSPAYLRPGGTMMMNGDGVDLSLEENCHIKPSYTYSQLISQAILSSKTEMETLAGIYKYCMDNYSWFRHQESNPKGWQNSIRHNLSLNHGFELKNRESHEPGKGGYWMFKSDNKEQREVLKADAWGTKTTRGSARRSPRDSNTPPGRASRTTHGPGDKNGGSPIRRLKRSPQSDSPAMGSYTSNGVQFTPDRGSLLNESHDSLPGDGSPLPRHRRPANSMFGLSDNLNGSPPVLSSSFAPEDNNPLVTPAPIRKHPYLAPPSTAQRPSQHMPTSSPAPFWRFADLGVTPLKIPGLDLSPAKGSDIRHDIPQSSSPPPRRDSGASPSKSGGEIKTEMPEADEIDEEPAFDLTRGFMKISKYHASSTNSVPLASTGRGQA